MSTTARARASAQEEHMTAQLASDLVLAFVGLLVLLGIIGVVLSFWHLGRQSYRKN